MNAYASTVEEIIFALAACAWRASRCVQGQRACTDCADDVLFTRSILGVKRITNEGVKRRSGRAEAWPEQESKSCSVDTRWKDKEMNLLRAIINIISCVIPHWATSDGLIESSWWKKSKLECSEQSSTDKTLGKIPSLTNDEVATIKLSVKNHHCETIHCGTKSHIFVIFLCP